jgi:hypothetical protein
LLLSGGLLVSRSVPLAAFNPHPNQIRTTMAYGKIEPVVSQVQKAFVFAK